MGTRFNSDSDAKRCSEKENVQTNRQACGPFTVHGSQRTVFHNKKLRALYMIPFKVCLPGLLHSRLYVSHSFQIAIFMYTFHNNVLPAAFHSFFYQGNKCSCYNTRFATKHSYYLPYARTNYGKFNIRFEGPSVWNTIDDNVKLSSSISVFKKRLKDHYFERY